MSKKNKNKTKVQYPYKSQVKSPEQEPQRPMASPSSPQKHQSLPPTPVKSQPTRVRSLEQERAADALRKVRARQGQAGYYVSYVSALPATIVMNGLGQALVMLLAKAKGKQENDHYHLYSDLASWLSHRVEGLKASSVDGVIERLMEGDQDLYVRAQTEAMAYLHWLKQFARAYLKEKEGQGD